VSLIERPAPPPDRRRITVASVVVAVACAVLVARLWYLQIVRGDELLRDSERNRTRILRRIPPRGLITDASGVVIATTRSRIVLRVLPEEVAKRPRVLDEVAALIGRPPAEVRAEYAAGAVDAFQPVRLSTDVGLEIATRVEERLYSLPGVLIGPEPVRHYPAGPAFGHVVGYVGQCSEQDLKSRAAAGYRRGDVCGKTGVEGGVFDGRLRGKDGGTTVEVDAIGRIQGALATRDPVAGATLRLNISADLQRVAYEHLTAHARQGRPGAAVALDPRSGAVLALVSAPAYDPALFAGGITRSAWTDLRDDPLKPLINRAVGSATAPGSVFKLVTAIAGLETGRTSRYDSAFCSGVMHLGRWPKRCHKRSGHGGVGLAEAIAKSCDVFFYRLGQRLGPDTMAAYARQMGFGARTGIDLPDVETAGIVPDPRWKERRRLGPWVGGDTVDYAIGQAMLGCTPLQVCVAVSAIANGGTLWTPQIVGSVRERDARGAERIEAVRPVVARRLRFRPGTLEAVRRGMEAVMQPGGTASLCSIPGLRIAGKTSTAQRRRRGELVDDAWFVAFAPVENPRIAVCVYVEEGGHGGTTAAPIARAMIAKYLRITVEAPAVEGQAGD
jgi:penicillin-binding protein 2